ncbi:hypothetical protein D3C81_2016860 [compost metagenome]
MQQMLNKLKARSYIHLTLKQNTQWFLITVWQALAELEQIRLVSIIGTKFFLILPVMEEMSGQHESHHLTQQKCVENNLHSK